MFNPALEVPLQYENFVDVVLTEDTWQSVMDITKECATGLFLEPMSESHPLFKWRLATLEEEYNNYMIYTAPQMIPDVGRFATGVVLASDDSKKGCAAGFILYSRDFHSDAIVGIIGIAVRRDYRLQGVMTAMVGKLRETVRDISLSCSLDMVRAYHRLGFEVRGTQGAQILMGWGGPGGDMAHFQAGSFDKMDSVQAELVKARSNLGDSYGKVFSDYVGLIHSETHKASAFFQKWKTDPTLLP
ncbi:GNAT family N-acetyltransferase [Pseudomonas frederiksbergensis]